MKKYITLSLLSILYFTTIKAQVPQSMNYQAVARNSAGNILANTTISLRFTIHDASAAGTAVFTETQNAIANQFGLVNNYFGQ